MGKTKRFQSLCELTAINTNLPASIWINSFQTYNRYVQGKYCNLLSFQLNKFLDIQKHNSANISLVNNKVINLEKILSQKNCKLSLSEISQIENFVQNNNFALLAIEVQAIFEYDFILELIIKGGKSANKKIQNEKVQKTVEVIIKHFINKDYNTKDHFLAVKRFLLSKITEDELLKKFDFKFGGFDIETI